MAQVIHMHVIAGFRADDTVLDIYHAKYLIAPLRLGRPQNLAESLPLTYREFLGADSFCHTKCGAEPVPSLPRLRKKIAELLTPFGKSSAN